MRADHPPAEELRVAEATQRCCLQLGRTRSARQLQAPGRVRAGSSRCRTAGTGDPAPPLRVERIALDPRGHDQERWELRHHRREVGQMGQRQPVRPVHVLDDQKARRDPARPLGQPGHRAPLALVARRVVHGVVEGPQLGRLRQVEQIVEKDGIIGRHQALGRRPFRHGLDSFGIACDVEAEKAPDEGADCVPSGAKVEHQAGVAGEARLARSVLELLDEARFTNARLAPNVDRLTPARTRGRRTAPP